MKTVGRRRAEGGRIAEQAAYVRMAAALRGTAFLVPRGVYRFRSFDEAEWWLNTTIRRTHARLTRSCGDAGGEKGT